MVADRYTRRQWTSESILRRERPDRRRSYQRGPRTANCEDNRDRTLTALGLVCGAHFYDLRGDRVAEDMILLTCYFTTSTPELPAVWCLEIREGILRPPPKIEGRYKDLVVVERPTSKQLPHLSQGRYSAW